MRTPHGRGLFVRQAASIAAALALPAAGLAFAASAEQPAWAEEFNPAGQFDTSFTQVAPQSDPALSPAALLEQAGPADSEPLIEEPPAEEPLLEELGSGGASYYGRAFAGKPTASGEPFNPSHLTAAHRSLPFGSKVKVTNHRNGKSVVVRINDRGPFGHGRVIDLSREAAERIGLIQQGHGTVKLALLAR